MKKLYQHAWKRLKNRVIAQTENTNQKIAEQLPTSLLNINHDVFHRLPRDDLRLAVRLPCHVEEQYDVQHSPVKQLKVVEASKMMRLHTQTEQGKICFKCPHKSACPVASKPPKGLQQTAIQDILTHFEALSEMPQDKVVPRVWNSSYKLCDSLGVILDDLKEGGNESKEYAQQRQRLLAKAEQMLEQLKKKQQEKLIKEEEDKKAKGIKKKKEAKTEPKEKKFSKIVQKDQEEQSNSELQQFDEEESVMKPKPKKQKQEAKQSTIKKAYTGIKGVSATQNKKTREQGQRQKGQRKQPFQDRERDERRKITRNNSSESKPNFVKKQFNKPRADKGSYDSKSSPKNHNKFQTDQVKFEKEYYKYDTEVNKTGSNKFKGTESEAAFEQKYMRSNRSIPFNIPETMQKSRKSNMRSPPMKDEIPRRRSPSQIKAPDSNDRIKTFQQPSPRSEARSPVSQGISKPDENGAGRRLRGRRSQ